MSKTAKFTEMVNGTAEDYLPIVEAGMEHALELPKRILEHLEMLKGDHGGFAVDRYTHCLQTATRAYRDGRNEEYVVCALLHDIGDILAPANRLRIPSLDMAAVFANNAPAGVSSALFRHDSDDFIIYGEDVDAYQFKGYDRILLGMAFRALALSGAPVDLGKPVVDGPFALRNFRAMRSRYYGEEGMRYDMYFSKDYRVNWWALGESWLFGSGGLHVFELDSALRRGEVPVRVEVFRGQSKLLSVNLMAADEYRIAESLVALPVQKILRSSTTLLKQLAAEAMGLE